MSDITLKQLIKEFRESFDHDELPEFEAKCGSDLPKLLDAMEVLIEGLEKVRDKETCDVIYPGSKKYISYMAGWEGVSLYAGKALQLAEEKVKDL